MTEKKTDQKEPSIGVPNDLAGMSEEQIAAQKEGWAKLAAETD